MDATRSAEQNLRDGDPQAALALVQTEVRTKPADPKLRIFLFQLLAVLGQWDRAKTQLDVAATLDPAAIAMAQMYGDALRCEVLRADVFAGKKSPMVFGEPEQWLAFLIEALLRAGRGESAEAKTLRGRAFDEAPTSAGSLDGQPFSWIADADMRLGPILEAIINGRYYWVPFARLARVSIDVPSDLRDMVWMPAHLQFENGGESVALIPTRYPGSEASGDGGLALARKTVWSEPTPEFFAGLGQRILTTDLGETPLLEVREIVLGASDSSGTAAAQER
jgi:type VI secretion system protein ImpE